jgi:hypothetical protein
MQSAEPPRGGLALIVTMTAVGALLTLAATAHAAPATIDFESGAAVNDPITNQYGAPGTPAGPEFKPGTEAGFKGLNCGPPHLAEGSAHSGTKSILLNGCPGGEFYPSAAFFHLGYSTDSVDFYVAAGSGFEVWSTAFKGQTVVQQVQTTLTGSGYQHVVLQTGGFEIDNVAIELGSKTFPNPESATGVNLSFGNTTLRVDDLTYDPPSSPPESSFLLGSNHPSTAVTPGHQVEVKIPITWSNNPNPSLSPVTLEASASGGVTASFSPNPTTTGTSTLTLAAAKSAPAGQQTITVDGYVDKGLGTEKHASTQIQLETIVPFFVSEPGATSVAPCTPKQVTFQVPTAGNFSDPLTIDVRSLQPSVTISAISPGEVLAPDHATATVSQQNGTASATVTFSAAAGTGPAGPRALFVKASSPGYADQTATGSLAVEPSSVTKLLAFGTNITPTSVSTPELGIPGTKLTLQGAGFCSGTTVGIGDPNRPATPESIASDGKSLTFRVPRSAVTGSVTVLPPAGDPFEGPQVQVKSFRNTFGMSWVNSGKYGQTLNGEMVDELFGEDETNINVFGWLIRKPEASLYEFIANKFIPKGICFGIAYSSQEMRQFPQEVSTFPRKGNDVWSLDASDKPSPALLRYVVERFSLQFTDQVIPIISGQVVGQTVNAHASNEDLSMIEGELAQGRPVEIGLIHWNGLTPEAHSVLAYDTAPNGDGRTAVFIANSNSPYTTGEEGNPAAHDEAEFKNSQILINENGHWWLEQLGWEGHDANLIVFKHDELPILNGKQPKLPSVFTSALTGAVLLVMGSAGDDVTQVSGSHGSEVFENGRLADPKSWPTGVVPFAPMTSSPGPLQLLYADARKAGPITATVKRGSKGGEMNMNLPGMQATIDAQTHKGQVDHVGVDPGGRFIDYQAGGASTPYDATLLAAGGSGGASSSASAPTLSEHLVKVGATAGGSGSEHLSFQGGRSFSLDHGGPAGPVSLTLSAIGKNGPVAVRLPMIRVSRGAAIDVTPLSWGALGSSSVRVRTKAGGKSSTRLVKGRQLGRAFATVRSAKLHAGKGGLILKLRVRHPSGEDWVSPAVTVLRGGHTIARSAPAQLIDAGLRRGTAKLKLSRSVPGGRYTLRIRLLEVTAEGPIQASKVVTRTFKVAAKG